jgi:hypothetical protein
VKIDGIEFDTHPNNQPHVGCIFQVDFYGFDEGDLDATVTFTAQAPTGKGEVLKTDTLPIGEDDNKGGGSQAGLDAERDYDLTSALVGKFTPHPKQGYHVKLTVNAEGSQGADTKHKVFWVEGCEGETTSIAESTTTSSSNSTTSSTPTTGSAGGSGTDTKAAVAGNTTAGGAEVQGESLTAPNPAVAGENATAPAAAGTVPAAGPAAALATTGPSLRIPLLAAALALSLGALARRFGRVPATPSS